MSEIKKILEERGFLHQYTHDAVFKLFGTWWQKFYFGVDLSAPSMTIGNFVALMMAIHFMMQWNKCYLLVGWATSTIWNPSWKDAERPILTPEKLAIHQEGIRFQFDRLCKNVEQVSGKKLDFEIVNNADFYTSMNVIDYLREVGRYMTVNWMISKDIVKRRINDPDKWISYAEFSYMLIMGYDFYYLYKNFWVTMEVGGSDEWDGILSGIELVSKKDGAEVYGVTNKLIMDANGKKFWKSEGNAIWLDSNLTSPYAMYQYFINTLDADVERYLKLFTFFSLEEIQNITTIHHTSPELRFGQKKLAFEVVKIIHSEQEAKLCEKISDFLFGDADKVALLKDLTWEEIGHFFKEIGGVEYTGQNLFGLFVQSGLEASNSTARQNLQNGGMFVNEVNITDGKYDFSNDWIDGRYLLLRKGKKNYKIVVKK